VREGVPAFVALVGNRPDTELAYSSTPVPISHLVLMVPSGGSQVGTAYCSLQASKHENATLLPPSQDPRVAFSRSGFFRYVVRCARE
jgi:hypothetical protein